MKKKALTAISLGAGLIMLASAAFANYTTANGYDVLKKSVIGLVGEDNYTLDSNFDISYDGENMYTVSLHEEYDDTTGMLYSTSTEVSEGETTYSNTIYSDGTTQYRQNIYENHPDIIGSDSGIWFREDLASSYSYIRKGTLTELGGDTDEDKAMSKKIIRFADLLCDTLVGDLKNNFTLVSSDDDTYTYEINLSSIQIPELVNAGFSLVMAESLNYTSEEYMSDEEKKLVQLGDNPTVTGASLIFTVDKEGNILDIKATGVLEGNSHKLTVNITGSVINRGTTVPKEPSQEIIDSAVSPDGYYNRYKETTDEE